MEATFRRGRPRKASSIADLPEEPGILRYGSEQDGITYIGKASNLRQEARQHRARGKYDGARDVITYQQAYGTRSRDLHDRISAKEKEKIRKHLPAGNDPTKGGVGRKPRWAL